MDSITTMSSCWTEKISLVAIWNDIKSRMIIEVNMINVEMTFFLF